MDNKTVLIVDDMRSMRLAISHTLESISIQNIEQASDGKQAIKMLKEKSYDLVISDLEMPDIDGIELLKFIRADEQLKETPFIMVSSVRDKKRVVEAIGQTVSGYIMKPINPALLIDRVSAILSTA